MADKLDGSAIVANTIPGTKIQSGTITTSQLDPSIAQIVSSPIHPKISSLDYPGDDTAANTGGGDTIVIRGSGFKNNVAVYINGNSVPSVTYNNANAVTITTAAQSSGSYLVYLINTDDGGTAILVPGIQYSGLPTWVTESPLDSQTATAAWNISLSATSDSAVSYELQAGSSLPAGITLAANGLISGTLSSPPANDTTYNFTVLAIDAELQDTPKAFSVSVTVTVDTKFQYTTLLLQADGTEGGNNHAFVDSSDNAFTITRNGNASQGSFSPFSPTGWSGYFDGTGDRITFTNQSTTGNFTCECWFFATANTSGGYHILFGGSGTGGATNTQLTARNDGTVGIALGGTSIAVSSSTPFSINTWNHIAWVRSGTTVAIFVNGIRAVTGTSSAALNVDRIGGQFSTYEPIGYISNARITTTAVYDPSLTTCTVPTAPLTAITGTYLLTLQDNRIVDRSASPLTLTKNGDVSVQAFSPYATTTAYSPTTHGGSGYFDGSGDYLSLASNAAFGFGTGDFTIEFWTFVVSTSNSPYWLDGRSTSTANESVPTLYINAGDYEYWVNGAARIDGGSVPLNQWVHVALVRNSGTTTLYSNGVSVGTWSDSTNYATCPILIGQRKDTTSQSLTGYISNFRIVKGTAVYTSAFTPPTSILTNIANTALLCSFSNANIYDSAAGSVLETVGDAKVNTSITKFGAGSMAFDGTGDWLQIPASRNLEVSGDVTIEFWVYWNSIGNIAMLFGWGAGASGKTFAYTYSDGRIGVGINGTNEIASAAGQATTGVWTHIAIVRSGSTTTIYKNGLSIASGTTAVWYASTGTEAFYIGGSGSVTDIDAYIDDLRITKGFARYRYNFTPPTKAFAPKGGTETLTADPYFPYTTLLLPGNGTNNQNNHTFLDSSDNSFAITRNGNATQGTFSPFSQTGWSAYFNGSSDYISVADSADFTMGSGDFTVQCWVYSTATTGSEQYILGQTNAAGSGSATSFQIYKNSTGTISAWVYAGAAKSATSPVTPLNQWLHLAMVRDGDTLRLYINGTQVATNATLSTTAIVDSTGSFSVGRAGDYNGGYFAGYVSNVSVVKGTCLFPNGTTFTPSTTPLSTSTSDQSVLLCQANRFIDTNEATTAKTVTVGSTASIQAFSPFAPTASYSAATNGGSGYFDGAGDYLTAPANSAYELSGDFTIEFWVKTAASDVNYYYRRVLCFGTDAANNPQLLFFNGSAASTNLSVYSSSMLITGSIAVATNEWNHVALCRSGTSLKLFVNGVQSGSTATTSQNFNAGASNGVYIGRYALDGGYLSGYMSGLRILKGTALYTTAFTPPTAPLTNIANTSLLLNFTNAGITDATAKNVFETIGDAKISTAQSKFGGSSIAFDGTGDRLYRDVRNERYFNLGNGGSDFTFECWVYFNALTGCVGARGGGFGGWNSTSGHQINLGSFSGGSFYIQWWNGSTIVSNQLTIPFATGRWYHYAITLSSGTLRWFIDGIQRFSTSATIVTPSQAYYFTLGDLPSVDGAMNGYMNDVRITEGIARYVQNFTLDLPTSAFLTK